MKKHLSLDLLKVLYEVSEAGIGILPHQEGYPRTMRLLEAYAVRRIDLGRNEIELYEIGVTILSKARTHIYACNPCRQTYIDNFISRSLDPSYYALRELVTSKYVSRISPSLEGNLKRKMQKLEENGLDFLHFLQAKLEE